VALVRRADRSLPGSGFATVADVRLSEDWQDALGKTLSSPVTFRRRFYSEGQLLVDSGTTHPRNGAADSLISRPSISGLGRVAESRNMGAPALRHSPHP
jgi:hypothetical protein